MVITSGSLYLIKVTSVNRTSFEIAYVLYSSEGHLEPYQWDREKTQPSSLFWKENTNKTPRLWEMESVAWYFCTRKNSKRRKSLCLKSSSFSIGRGQWHPTPVLLPGESHGRRSLVGCSPWGLEESDTTEQLHFHFSLSYIGEGNGNPLQCSCLENPRDGRAWWAAVYGAAQSRTRLKRLSSSSRFTIGLMKACLFSLILSLKSAWFCKTDNAH